MDWEIARCKNGMTDRTYESLSSISQIGIRRNLRIDDFMKVQVWHTKGESTRLTLSFSSLASGCQWQDSIRVRFDQNPPFYVHNKYGSHRLIKRSGHSFTVNDAGTDQLIPKMRSHKELLIEMCGEIKRFSLIGFHTGMNWISPPTKEVSPR